MAPEKTPCAIRQTCHNFVDFLSALNNSAFSHSVYRELNDEPKPVYTYGKSPRGYMKSPLFSPESPLYRLLHSDSTKSIGISDQRAAEACQIPCLIYINLTVLEYADRPYLADNFLCKLMNCVYEDNLDTSVSPEQLLMRLLLGIDGSESEKAERLYAMARLAFVAKRVGKNSEEKLRAALLMNLIMTDGPPREIPLITWDPRDLETEMLRD